MTVLVETFGIGDEPYNINGIIARKGFQERGYHIAYFPISNIDIIEFQSENPVIATIGTYNKIFKKMGINGWNRESYPKQLEKFLGRRTGIITVKEMCKQIKSLLSVFVKPFNDDKKFSGFVCNYSNGPILKFASLEDETLLSWSDVVKFVSEYRVYVLDGKILNVSRYIGPVDVLPDMKIVREMVNSYSLDSASYAYSKEPIAYGLDVGITDKGETLLVEVNESLALGNYGLPCMLHAKMIGARWFQLMGDVKSMRDEVGMNIDSPSYINSFMK